MEYHEAAQIAKQNPGSVLTSDQTGSFIVRLNDGRILGVPQSNTAAVEQLLQGREKHAKELYRIQANFTSREEYLKAEVIKLGETCTNLRATVSAANFKSAELTQQLETLRTVNAVLQTKLSKVSDAEWEKITESDRLQREAEAVQRKADRRKVKCACSGEVENCARCFGVGEYDVDGYSNVT